MNTHHSIKMLIWEESRHEGVKFASEADKTYVVQHCTGFRLWILRETMEIVLGNVNFMVVYWLDKTMPMVEMRCAWWK